MSQQKVLKKQSLKKNFIFQFLYQALILIIPLIVSPYLTRVLTETGLGNYTFVNSIAYYFVVGANLGIAKHGQRIIASASDQNIKRKKFWSLFVLHAAISVMILAVYIVLCFSFFDRENFSLYLIETIYVASALFDITWLFYGLENFGSVVLKNAIIKVLELVLVFTLVKKEQDVFIYALIASSSLLIGNLVLFPQALRSVPPIGFSIKDIKEHIKPMLVFSISVVAVSLYTIFDKTLLGLMTTKENVAFYEYANRIIVLPRTFIVVIGTVMFPRSCFLASVGDYEGQKKYLKTSLLGVYFIGMASLFGLLAVAKPFSTIYYGNGFSESGNIMMAMSALPLIVGLGDIIRMQFLIPNGFDKQYTICIVISAIINLIISVSLIPFLGVYGAVIGTCTAELFGTIFQLVICKKFINFKNVFTPLMAFFVVGLIMYRILSLISFRLDTSIIALIVEVLLGVTIYTFLSLLYFVVFDRSTLKLIISFFRKNKHGSKHNIN